MKQFDYQENPDFRERKKEVTELMTKYKSAFDLWTSQPNQPNFQEIPQEALKYLFISEPILYFAQNPQNVDVIPTYQNLKTICALVVEHKQFSCSNPESYRNYVERIKNLDNVKDWSPLPDDVDNFHVICRDHIAEGKLSLNDFVFNSIALRKQDQQLTVEEYQDRLKHMNAARKFYEKLNYIAKKLGFRFIGGSNKRPDFFKHALGRSTLADIKPELRDSFFIEEIIRKSELDYHTIGFLYPEDRQKYLINSPKK